LDAFIGANNFLASAFAQTAVLAGALAASPPETAQTRFAKALEDWDEFDGVHVSIADTGIGIGPADVSKSSGRV
jgi:uncharacterized protein (DUF2147 family)